MLKRLKHHIEQGDADSRKEVQRIIVKEGNKKWKHIYSTFGKERSLPASKVVTMSEDRGSVVQSNKVDVHLALKEHLGRRFQITRNSLITRGQIFQDLGHLANTDTADDILHGRYKCPPDMDKGTNLLLREVARLYAKNKGVDNYVLKDEDFTLFWNTAS